MPEEREVKARLDVERTGDTDAFEEIARDVDQLGEGAGSTDTSLAELQARLERLASEARALSRDSSRVAGTLESAGGATDEFSEAAGRGGGRVRDLDDLLKRVAPSIASFAARWSVAIGAVVVAEKSLQGIEAKLNDLSESVGGAGDEFDGLAGVIPGLEKNIETLGFLINNTDDAVAAFRDTQGSLIEKLYASADAFQTVLAGVSEYREAILGVDEALDQQTEAITSTIRAMEEQGEVGAHEAERIRELIQEQVDKYIELKKAGPDALQEIAARYGVLSTATQNRLKEIDAERERHEKAAERAAKAQEQAAERASKAWQSYTDGLKEQLRGPIVDLEKLTAALPDVLASLDFSQLDRTLDPEGFQRAQDAVNEWLEAFRTAGQVIPNELARAALAVDAQISVYELATAATAELATSAAEAGRVIVERAEDGTLSMRQLGEATRETGDIIVSTAEDGSIAMSNVGEEAKAASKVIVETLPDGSKAMRQVTDEADKTSEALSGAGSAGEEGMLRFSESITVVDGQLGVLEQTANSVASISGEIGRSLGEGVRGASRDVGDLVGTLERVPAALESAFEATASVGEFRSEVQGLSGDLEEVLSAVTAIRDRLGEAATAAASLAAAGGG